MKKSLFLLPLVGGFMLSACTFNLFGKEIKLFEKESSSSGSGSGSTTPSGSGSTTPSGDTPSGSTDPFSFPTKDSSVFVEIDYDDIKSHMTTNTYPSADFEFESDGVSFAATKSVGWKTANTTGGNYYNENHSMQFRSAKHANGAGKVTTKEATTATKVTVHWFATYEEEETKYHPIVYTGDSASSCTTAVNCSEGTKVKGQATGGKEYDSNAKKDWDVYFFTTTYDVSGKSFFAVSAPDGACYIHDIWIHH